MRDVANEAIANGFLLLGSILFSMIIIEASARIALDPIDYLLPILGPDSALNHSIEPHSGGHDGWGFRNDKVPTKSSIVAIGDSMTYGVSATAKDSWPAQLEKLGGQEVYNMGLGGFGPLHYLHLLEDKGLSLSPTTIFVGFYFGNDLMDSYNLTYSNKNWERFRRPGSKTQLDSQLFIQQEQNTKFMKGTRNWLARHSLAYRLITQAKVFDFVRARELNDKTGGAVELEYDGRKTLFPLNLGEFIDTHDEKIQEALEITKMAFLEMNEICIANDIRLVFVLIPTKQRVFEQIYKSINSPPLDSKFDYALENEAEAQNELLQFLSNEELEYVDLLPALQSALKEKDIYPATDGHPNGRGYSVIAAALSSHMN